MSKVAQALTIAFEFVGQRIDEYAIAEMVADLEAYPEAQVLAALKRCRQELRSIKFADIIDRIPGGHPGVEEAWALVARSLNNESVSIVWTDQMREAMGVALALGNDPIAARMAFKETYARSVSEARAKREVPKWSASLGWDPHGREIAQIEAENRNRITLGLPALQIGETLMISDGQARQLVEQVSDSLSRK